MYYANCNESYRAGGVIVYISSQLRVISYEPVDMSSADVLKISLLFDIDETSRSLSIVAVYRLHAFPVRLFLEQIKDCLINSNDRNLLLVGDINLCILEQSQLVDDYQVIMNSHGLGTAYTFSY